MFLATGAFRYHDYRNFRLNFSERFNDIPVNISFVLQLKFFINNKIKNVAGVVNKLKQRNWKSKNLVT